MYFVGLNRRQRQARWQKRLWVWLRIILVSRWSWTSIHKTTRQRRLFKVKTKMSKYITLFFLLYSGKYNLKVVMAQAKLALSLNSLIFSCLQVDLLVAASTPTSVLSLGWHRALTLDRRSPSPGGMSRRAWMSRRSAMRGWLCRRRSWRSSPSWLDAVCRPVFMVWEKNNRNNEYEEFMSVINMCNEVFCLRKKNAKLSKY